MPEIVDFFPRNATFEQDDKTTANSTELTDVSDIEDTGRAQSPDRLSSISSISSSLATDSSSLVDLKAEVFRKQQEASFNKLHGGALRLKSQQKAKSNKDKIWSKQNAGLTSREKRDLEVEDERQKRISSAVYVFRFPLQKMVINKIIT